MKMAPSSKFPAHSVGVYVILSVGIAIAILMFFASRNAINLAVYYTPLIDTVMEIKLEVAMSRNPDPDSHKMHPDQENYALMHLKDAERCLAKILNGESHETGAYPEVSDLTVRQDFETIRKDILALITYVSNDANILNSSNYQDKVDADRLFRSIFATANHVERILLTGFKKDLSKLRIARIVLITFVVIFSLFSALSYGYFKRRRQHAENLLMESNEQISNSQKLLQHVINGSNLGYWDWNYKSGNYQVNDRWLEMLGLDRKEISDHIDDWSTRIHPDDMYQVIKEIDAHIESGSNYSIDYRMKHKDGHWVWVQCSGAVVEFDDSGTALRLCGTHQDISEPKDMESRLRYLATHDQLTDLHNRRIFMERLHEEIDRASRYNNTLSLFMIDIDHFKQINDEYGHMAGDRILIDFSRLLIRSMRKSDFTARYGGEEFAVLLPETSTEAALDLAERFRKQVYDIKLDNGNEDRHGFTISIGIATFPEHGKKTKDLISAADTALYEAKHTGRNKVVSYTAGLMGK